MQRQALQGRARRDAGGRSRLSTKCVAGGAKNVFVSADGKTVYKIANQDFAGLKIHAGHKVALTGELKGDTITVSKIEMPAAKAK